jgi:DNA-3-methyladenine glycosylase
VEAARLLLGAFLCRKDARGRTHRWRVLETEAYNGAEDLACHASKGLTPRTAVLFGPAGFWYVYLCYGVHWLLNVVTREKGFPSAVLLRGTMETRPAAKQTPPAVFDGPGKVTKAAGVNKCFNAAPASRASGLWLESAAAPLSDSQISVTPRIGVGYAGPIWSQKPWRFVVKNQTRTLLSGSG